MQVFEHVFYVLRIVLPKITNLKKINVFSSKYSQIIAILDLNCVKLPTCSVCETQYEQLVSGEFSCSAKNFGTKERTTEVYDIMTNYFPCLFNHLFFDEVSAKAS